MAGHPLEVLSPKLQPGDCPKKCFRGDQQLARRRELAKQTSCIPCIRLQEEKILRPLWEELRVKRIIIIVVVALDQGWIMQLNTPISTV